MTEDGKPETEELLDVIEELVAAFDRRWGEESARKREANISPRMEEAFDKARAILERINAA